MSQCICQIIAVVDISTIVTLYNDVLCFGEHIRIQNNVGHSVYRSGDHAYASGGMELLVLILELIGAVVLRFQPRYSSRVSIDIGKIGCTPDHVENVAVGAHLPCFNCINGYIQAKLLSLRRKNRLAVQSFQRGNKLPAAHSFHRGLQGIFILLVKVCFNAVHQLGLQRIAAGQAVGNYHCRQDHIIYVIPHIELCFQIDIHIGVEPDIVPCAGHGNITDINSRAVIHRHRFLQHTQNALQTVDSIAVLLALYHADADTGRILRSVFRADI